MKILINTPEFSRLGGVASYHQALKPHLSSEADYFIVGARLNESGFFMRVIRLIGDYFRFLACLCRNNYDLIFLNPSFRRNAVIRDGLFLLLARAFRIKCLVFFHGWNPDDERVFQKSTLHPFLLIYSQANAFIVLANRFAERLRNSDLNVPVYIDTTAVDDSEFTEYAPNIRQNPQDAFCVLFLARIEESKGIYETLEAFSIFNKTHTNSTLIVAGEGTERQLAERYVEEHAIPNITFSGYLRGKEKRQAFAQSHCYLLPSKYNEGMPISVLEAMAHGLPVITRSLGALNDFFENEKMGFITDSMNPAVIADYLLQLARNPNLCARMGQYNREFAQERFAASQVAVRIRTICTNLVEGNVVPRNK